MADLDDIRDGAGFGLLDYPADASNLTERKSLFGSLAAESPEARRYWG